MTITPTAEGLIAARYGETDTVGYSAPFNKTLAVLYGHRSIRSFTGANIDEPTIAALIAAGQSAATSSNFQSWSVIEIRDPSHKDRIASLSGDQDFIRQAPVFLVFVADWARNRLIAERHGSPTEGINYIDTTFVGFVDAALAAQNTVIAAESLGLGTVYVGAVRNHAEKLSKALELPPSAFPVVGLALGYPDASATGGIKPRLPQDIVRHRERYTQPTDEAVARYDQRIAAYYASQDQPRGWVESVLRRVRDRASLHGRDRIRDALRRRGFPSL
ncbi:MULTISPECIES: NADPH-dependent oxidoreductase [unclassified Pseudarthrobacter]|uniref:NADPH-dependent oxidoreductase n=1 Tax=unclassified Pseudarthrobacter TaxID=2647000 RepID=UPI0036274ED6